MLPKGAKANTLTSSSKSTTISGLVVSWFERVLYVQYEQTAKQDTEEDDC